MLPAALTVKVAADDVPPPGAGVKTVTWDAPAVTTSPAGSCAVRRVFDTNVVVSAVPFQCTTELAANPDPDTVSVCAGAPAATLAGEMPETTGVRLLTVTPVLPLLLSTLAETVVVPAESASTVPSAPTVATDASLDAQITVRVSGLPAALVTVAVSCVFAPTRSGCESAETCTAATVVSGGGVPVDELLPQPAATQTLPTIARNRRHRVVGIMPRV